MNWRDFFRALTKLNNTIICKADFKVFSFVQYTSKKFIKKCGFSTFSFPLWSLCSSPLLVSLAVVFSIVTQRSSPQTAVCGEERCVTILKTTARETSRGLEHNDHNGNENVEKPHFLINFFDVYCTKEKTLKSALQIMVLFNFVKARKKSRQFIRDK